MYTLTFFAQPQQHMRQPVGPARTFVACPAALHGMHGLAMALLTSAAKFFV
jgi:hypothetical protein